MVHLQEVEHGYHFTERAKSSQTTAAKIPVTLYKVKIFKFYAVCCNGIYSDIISKHTEKNAKE